MLIYVIHIHAYIYAGTYPAPDLHGLSLQHVGHFLSSAAFFKKQWHHVNMSIWVSFVLECGFRVMAAGNLSPQPKTVRGQQL